MIRAFRLFFSTALVLLVAGCSGAGFDIPLEPSAVSHMDVSLKQTQIASAKSTLKVFNGTALDLRQRDKPEARENLAAEFKRYVDLQVQPLVTDFEAASHLQTLLEIAQLQLLTGRVYLELQEHWEVYKLVRDMQRRYGDQPDVLNAAIDRNDIGFSTIADGIRGLEERRARESLMPQRTPTDLWRQ